MTNEIIEIPTINLNKKVKTIEIVKYKKQQWIDIVENQIFKEPGKYKITKAVYETIRSEALKFIENKEYTSAPYKSIDFIEYWDQQKLLCRKGLLIKNNEYLYYIPREYYFWLNFLPIYRKKESSFGFPDLIDFQLHMALYEYIAELKGLHAAILKKRQAASSYYHAAKLINWLWFEEGVVLKAAAYSETYLSSLWKYFEEYKNFLNEYTGWYRSMLPDTYKHWVQKYETKTSDGKKITRGNKSSLIGIIADNTGSKAVSGHCKYFFHDEAGISPLMLDIFEYVLPSIRYGDVYTGQFIAAGSVGELSHANGLKTLILNPQARDVYAVKTKFYDKDHNIRTCGLFIPEQWGMYPYIDEYGNSLVEEAMEALMKERERWKKELPFDKYQLRISQMPMYITEAFSVRKESRFPLDIIRIQEERIANKHIPVEYVDLEYDQNGNIVPIESNRLPILDVPVKMDLEDKRGVVCIYERPVKSLPFGSYIASVDPVATGKTVSSDSLASIYVYKMPIELKNVDNNGNVISISYVGDKVVCSWAGRYDDINDTFDTLLKIMEYYNAYTIVENNSWNFIQHVIYRKKQHLLVPSNKINFTKELGFNTMTFKEYGYSMTNQMFNNNLIPYLIDFIKEKIGEEKDNNGNVIRTIYGIERIPDIMALEEMKKFEELRNKDRLVTLSSLVAYVKVLTSNYGYIKHAEEDKSYHLHLPLKKSKLLMSTTVNKRKSYFKNIRL